MMTIFNRKKRQQMIFYYYIFIWLVLSSLCHLTSSSEDDTHDRQATEEASDKTASVQDLLDNNNMHVDIVDDSMFDPLQADPSCNPNDGEDCYAPPLSTFKETTTTQKIDATCFKGGGDEDEDSSQQQQCSGETTEEVEFDQHWGKDPNVHRMRDMLRKQAQDDPMGDSRPPIFLLPGLASTRLVAWKHKKCTGAFARDIRVQDNVWLNLNLVVQMGTVDVHCMKDCLKLGMNQSDTDDWDFGCKLRPDEGLDAIASLAPGGIGSNLMIGGTNTVYAWLVQWLSDNMGYDVTNIIGLPYDWRLSPDKMEKRDGFLSMMRRRMEAAVASNGQPGIMVAHSMGNVIFRYFLEWLRIQMRQEAYDGYVSRARRRAQSMKKMQNGDNKDKNAGRQTSAEAEPAKSTGWSFPGWINSVATGVDEWYEWLTEEVTDVTTLEGDDAVRHAQLVQLAEEEGDAKWQEWLDTHVWTYVGLSNPMLGAVNPLRAVISGENMGLPISDEVAREMEITFGSTHTINPISASTGFCDVWDASGDGAQQETATHKMNQMKHNLACLDDIMKDIELSSVHRDPWENFQALKQLMRDRIDWDTGKRMIGIDESHCVEKSKRPCEQVGRTSIGPKQVANGDLFDMFHGLWKEEGDKLVVKKNQLQESFWDTKIPNILNQTWDRPLIKHVIMAYGVDYPTEVGYIYNKEHKVDKIGADPIASDKPSGVPDLKAVIWEGPRGQMTVQHMDNPRGGIADVLIKKKIKREPLDVGQAQLAHSGDGSVPYLSLSWAHTWLLHAARAKRFSEDDRAILTDKKNALDHINISHRPLGEMEWIEGPPPQTFGQEDPNLREDADTGTSHPHGTRYKPEMIRYHNVGRSRTTGIEYTTSVIEAIGVEHKETTRNYDILAAVFTDVLKYMHDDLGLIDG